MLYKIIFTLVLCLFALFLEIRKSKLYKKKQIKKIIKNNPHLKDFV